MLLKRQRGDGVDKDMMNMYLVIKYSKDLIGDNHQWRTRANRSAASSINIKENDFEKKQQSLVKNQV